MKLLFASDSFKGSLSSKQIHLLLEQAASEVFPDAESRGILMADGGEGTVPALVEQLGGEIRTVTVHGPLFQPVDAS